MSDTSPVKVSYTLSESIKQLSKPPETIPFIKRPDWHAAQLLLVLVVVGAYVGSWCTDEVALVVRHHRLETFDKRRIMMLVRDERVRMLAAETQPHINDQRAEEVYKLRIELEQVQEELSNIKAKLRCIRQPEQQSPTPPLLHVFKGWVPKVNWTQ